MDAPSISYRRAADPLFRFVVGTALLLGTAFVASYLYWGSGPILGETPWYVPTMHAFTGLAAFIAAFLALGRHRVLRDAPSYWIGVGFGAFGVLSAFFILTWPGLAPGGVGIIARLPGTSAWMALLELGILSLSLLAAVLVAWPGERALTGRSWFWSVAVPFLAVASLAGLATAFEERLPALIGADGRLSVLLLSLDWVFLLLFAVGAVLSLRRYLLSGDTLLGYAALTQVALAFVVLTAIIGTKRYDVWYYLSRIVLVGGFLSMLFGILSEYVGFFRREREKTRELEARTAELLGVLKSSPEAVFVTDEKGGVRLASRKALDLLGARSERELSRPVAEWATPFETRDREGRLLPPDELPLARVGRGEVVQEEEVQFRDSRNGSAIWLLVSGGPLADEQGRRIGGLLVATDITERKAAEEALRDSEERLRIAVESVNLGTWDLDLRTDVAVRSLRHDQIWGYEEPQAEWGLEIAMRNVVPEDRQSIMDAYARAMETEVLKHENRVVWPDGSIHWIDVDGRIYRDREGRAVRVIGVVADVTERKAAEAERERLLEEVQHRAAEAEWSRAQLAAVFEAAPDGIMVFDPDGRVVLLNAAASLMHGYADPEGMRGDLERFSETLGVYFPNGELAPLDQWAVPRALRGESLRDIVFRVHRRDTGQEWWFSYNSEPVRDSSGRIVMAVLTIRDITERRVIEAERERLLEEVRRRAAELDAVVSSMVAGVSMYDAAGRLILMNPAGERMLGYSEADKALPLPERIGIMRMESREGRPLSSEETPMGRALRGETVQTDTIMAQLRDGRSFWMWASAAPILGSNGQVLGAVATFTDVSEQHELQQAQARLLGEQERLLAELEATIDHVPDPLMVWDREGRLLRRNAAARRLLEEDKRLSEYRASYKGYYLDGRPMPEEELPFSRVLRGETLSGFEAVALNTVAGERRIYSYSGGVVRDRAGEIILAVTTYRDVTAQKEAEAQRERLLEAEREAREQAERAVRIRDEFLYVAAHELKTPVTSLRGFSQTVIRKFNKSGTLEQDLVTRALSRIDQQSKRLSALTEELLNVSRLETGKLTVTPEEVDVPGVVSAAIASVRESYPDRAFLFRKDVSVRACLDPSRMEQVIINLLDNAAKFSPEEAPVEIEISRYGHEEVAISVRDYGRGIPGEHRERIFERFYQAHEERHYGGLGLGLYISSQIVQMHGGTITCEAPDGKGARFVVRLPLGCGNGRDN